MAARGQPFERSIVVAEPPAAVARALLDCLSGAPGYVASTADGAMVLTRRYTPTWAIVASLVVQVWPFIWLYKVRETLAVTYGEAPGGTRIRFSGDASTEMASRIAQLTAGGLWLHPHG